LIRAAWAVAALAVIVLVLPNAWILAASAGRVSDYGEEGGKELADGLEIAGYERYLKAAQGA